MSHNIEVILHNIYLEYTDEGRGKNLIDLMTELACLLGLRAVFLPSRPATRDIPTEAPELYRNRQDRMEKPPGFIRRVYGRWLGAGLIRADLLKLDRPLYQALQNWLRHNDMPDWLDLPTLSQVNDRMLAELEGGEATHPNLYPAIPDELKQEISLYHAARNRRRNQTT